MSWAHHNGTVAAAVAHRAVGVDVISRADFEELAGGQADGRSICRAEALCKAGAGTLSDLIRLDSDVSDGRAHVDRENRRLRLSDHSTPEYELWTASSCDLRPLGLSLLTSAADASMRIEGGCRRS